MTSIKRSPDKQISPLPVGEPSEKLSSKKNPVISKKSRDGGQFSLLEYGSSCNLSAKIRRIEGLKHLQPKDRDLLVKIFEDTGDDPEWQEESVLYKLFCNRISVVEFLSLISADENWTHFASKK